MKKLAVLIAAVMLLLPAVFATYYSTSTWDDWSTTTNQTNNSFAQITLGREYAKTLGTFSYTNASISANCTELKWLLEYDGTNTSWYQTTSTDLSSLSAKVIKPYFNVSLPGTAGTESGCILTDIQLTWVPGGSIDADTIQGLPSIGSDVGSFLKNLAPGIGAFIIILGVFVAIGSIFFVIVFVVKSKTQV